MYKNFFVLALSLTCICSVFSQNKSSSNQKENDFVVAVINNQSYCLGDLILMGMNERNTQFLSETEYLKSKYIQNRYSSSEFHDVYRKCSSTWPVFLKLSKMDINTINVYVNSLKPIDSYDALSPRYSNLDPIIKKSVGTIPLRQN